MPESTKPSAEVVERLIEATGLKLSDADMKALRAGRRVVLDEYTIGDLGNLFIHGDASRASKKEPRSIKDLLTGGTSGGAVPRIKVKCVKIGRVTCCLEAGWPPYIAINCSGTF